MPARGFRFEHSQSFCGRLEPVAVGAADGHDDARDCGRARRGVEHLREAVAAEQVRAKLGREAGRQLGRRIRPRLGHRCLRVRLPRRAHHHRVGGQGRQLGQQVGVGKARAVVDGDDVAHVDDAVAQDVVDAGEDDGAAPWTLAQRSAQLRQQLLALLRQVHQQLRQRKNLLHQQ